MKRLAFEFAKLATVLIFAFVILQLVGCVVMSEQLQTQYDACADDECRKQVKAVHKEDMRFAAAERKAEAFEEFLTLPARCRAAGLVMAFHCDGISKACRRGNRVLGIDDYSIFELASAGCMDLRDLGW